MTHSSSSSSSSSLLALASPLIIVVLGACGGCTVIEGNGRSATEARTVVAFDSVDAAGGVDVRVDRGDRAVSVTCDENLLAEIVVRVDEGVLIVEQRDGRARLDPVVECFVAVASPQLDGVRTSGAGALDVADAGAIARIESNGAGTTDVNGIDTVALDVRVDGLGGVVLAGSAELVTIAASGDGDVDASALTCAHAIVVASGSGSVVVRAEDAVDVELSGTGSVVVRGNPDERNIDDDGPGAVSFE